MSKHWATPKMKKELMENVIERDGAKCHYCNIPLVSWYDIPWKGEPATLDHVIPQSRGGSNSIDNLVLCCSECNYTKGAR